MREIKFRGQMVTGEWVYGWLTKDMEGSTAYYPECSYRVHWETEGGGQANGPVKNETVGQYTGMDDRKENPIYEGDIVTYNLHIDKQNEPASVAVVAFIFAAFQVFMQKRQVEYHAYLGDCTNIEVIGNIHDNPELWEVDDDKKQT